MTSWRLLDRQPTVEEMVASGVKPDIAVASHRVEAPAYALKAILDEVDMAQREDRSVDERVITRLAMRGLYGDEGS